MKRSSLLVLTIVFLCLDSQNLFGQFDSGFPEGHLQGISKHWPTPIPSWPPNHDETFSKTWRHDVETSQNGTHNARISDGWPGGHYSSISKGWPKGTGSTTTRTNPPLHDHFESKMGRRLESVTTTVTYPIHDTKTSSTYGHVPNHYYFVSKTWGHRTETSSIGNHQLSVSEHWPGNHITDNSNNGRPNDPNTEHVKKISKFNVDNGHGVA
jgi:hypothetical protein